MLGGQTTKFEVAMTSQYVVLAVTQNLRETFYKQKVKVQPQCDIIIFSGPSFNTVTQEQTARLGTYVNLWLK